MTHSDLSFTMFLNKPSEWDGGELIIDSASGMQSVELRPAPSPFIPAASCIG